MNTKKNIFKNSIIFILVFLITTVLFFASLSKILNDNTFDSVFGEYIPVSNNIDDSLLNWDKISELGGSGFVVDGNKVIRTYNKKYNKEYSYSKLLDFVTLGGENQSTFVFNTYDGNKFFLNYPSEKVSSTVNFNLNKGKSSLKTNVLLFLLLAISSYILIVYFIVRWLFYKINNELAEIYNKQEKEKDILELVRRYVGDNYSYFLDNKTFVKILFNEDDKFFIDVDEKLFQRVLQNLIQNSIDHNKNEVIITIDFKIDKLIFKDNGKGIDPKNIENIFVPLFTEDASRQGEKLRGMGLSNVKKICDLHKWQVYYKDGFVIAF